jgi:hypothetical protein
LPLLRFRRSQENESATSQAALAASGTTAGLDRSTASVLAVGELSLETGEAIRDFEISYVVPGQCRPRPDGDRLDSSPANFLIGPGGRSILKAPTLLLVPNLDPTIRLTTQ